MIYIEKQNESRLVYEVMHELGKHGEVFRTNAGSVRLPNGKTFRGLPKGHSDLVFYKLPNGKACFVEVKVRPNKPTPEQAEFIKKMLKLGYCAGVAYSVDEALNICELENNDT